MKDRWINTGFEEDELKPYTEPELDITDQKRIGTNRASSRACRVTAPFFHQSETFASTWSFAAAESEMSCCVREGSVKASKQPPPFAKVWMLCDICQGRYLQIPT